MDLGLKGKIALVTGGSDGIGKATATSLANEGAKVVICARRLEILKTAAVDIQGVTRGEVMPVQADVTRPDQIKRLFDQLIDTYGRIDILVNNAGTTAAYPFEVADEQVWQSDLDLKLHAAIRCVRLAVPHMKSHGGGRIINVTSVGGKTPGPRSVPTSVSRAAGIALTKALSKEYAPDNILVNTVCIGLIKAGQHVPLWQQDAVDNHTLTLEQWYEQQGKNVPLGRYGEAKEAGDLIAFLASERASYITGVAINIDGGDAAVV